MHNQKTNHIKILLCPAINKSECMASALLDKSQSTLLLSQTKELSQFGLSQVLSSLGNLI